MTRACSKEEAFGLIATAYACSTESETRPGPALILSELFSTSTMWAKQQWLTQNNNINNHNFVSENDNNSFGSWASPLGGHCGCSITDHGN